jgi:hypothetical protein
MNQELNVSIELSTVAADAAEHTVATPASPMVLDQALLAQVGGGLSTCGPNGTW